MQITEIPSLTRRLASDSHIYTCSGGRADTCETARREEGESASRKVKILGAPGRERRRETKSPRTRKTVEPDRSLTPGSQFISLPPFSIPLLENRYVGNWGESTRF